MSEQSTSTLNIKDVFPLAKKRPDLIKTPTGKTLDDITIEGVVKGEITPEDVRITPETLEIQAKVAEYNHREVIANNLRRAAELTVIPDEEILSIYNALRPYRSTKEELYEIADGIEKKYQASINSAFIREAADVYEKRGRLRDDEE